MQILLDQYRISENFGENLRHLEKTLDHSKDVDLVIAPELCTSGAQWQKIEEVTSFNRMAISRIREICKKKKIAFFGSFLWKETGFLYNRGFYISNTGQIGITYDKNHLIDTFHEKEYLKAGNRGRVIRIAGLKVAFAICYDLRFPELFRGYLKDNADLFIISALWPKERIDHMISLSKARAIENQAAVAVVNGCGKCLKTQMGGHSMVIDQKGKSLTSLKMLPVRKKTEIDRDKIQQWRETFPAIKDYLNKKS